MNGKTSVTRARYIPLNLRAGRHRISPAITDANVLKGIVAQIGILSFEFNRAEVYALAPKKNAWPRLNCPVNPERKSQLAAKREKRRERQTILFI
jgi:hypothetical protein